MEAWGRSWDNPVGGWYGLRNGYRGRFGMYLPPLLEQLVLSTQQASTGDAVRAVQQALIGGVFD